MTRIGLVLGGGGIAGHAYHIAALSSLQEATGWDPRTADFIVGTSAGSGIAAMLRGGVPIDSLLDRLLTLPTNPRDMARLRRVTGRQLGFPVKWWAGPAAPGLLVRELARGFDVRLARLALGLVPAGRVPTDVIGERSRELHADEWPEADTWIVTVRLHDGERVVFGREHNGAKLAEAVEASSAIPGFFQPVRIDGHRFVDGGMHSPTNADLLVDQDLDLVVVLAPMSSVRGAAHQNILGPARSFCRLVVRRETKALKRSGIATVLVEPSAAEIRSMGANLMDPTRALEVSIQTAASMTERLDHPTFSDALAVLSRAGRERTSPADVELKD